jgi:hypothetical protein
MKRFSLWTYKPTERLPNQVEFIFREFSTYDEVFDYYRRTNQRDEIIEEGDGYLSSMIYKTLCFKKESADLTLIIIYLDGTVKTIRSLFKNLGT